LFNGAPTEEDAFTHRGDDHHARPYVMAELVDDGPVDQVRDAGVAVAPSDDHLNLHFLDHARQLRHRVAEISFVALSLFFRLRLGTIILYLGLAIEVVGYVVVMLSLVDHMHAPTDALVTAGLYQYSRNPPVGAGWCLCGDGAWDRRVAAPASAPPLGRFLPLRDPARGGDLQVGIWRGVSRPHEPREMVASGVSVEA
jgi:hypothetical protein